MGWQRLPGRCWIVGGAIRAHSVCGSEQQRSRHRVPKQRTFHRLRVA